MGPSRSLVKVVKLSTFFSKSSKAEEKKDYQASEQMNIDHWMVVIRGQFLVVNIDEDSLQKLKT